MTDIHAIPLDRMRDIPLEPLAVALGYRRDPTDRARYRRHDSVISINNGRFYDHRAATGGGGAIDLVIHATGCRFPDALRFLRDHAPAEPDGTVARAPRRLQLPRDTPAAWPGVRDALVRNRALSADILDTCRTCGSILADHRHNAVFICRTATGQITGAELLGTRHQAGARSFKGMAPGSRKARGGFHIACDTGTPRTVILTESAVDALSARCLRIDPTPRTGAVIVSTAGVATTLPAWIEDWKPDRIVCAYDADETGDHAASRLARTDPRVTRLRPEGEKDWNELLRKRSKP